MAFITQEAKKIIAAKLKQIVPSTWKYSLSINGHSTIVMRVKSAPVVIDGENTRVNPYSIYRREIKLINDIIAALNTDNFDHSDIQSDYHNVGHYIALNFGEYGTPFVSTGSEIDLRNSTSHEGWNSFNWTLRTH